MVTLDPQAEAGILRVRRDPAAFIQHWLGADLWQKQVEIAESVRDHRRTAVRSCHGSGKSYLSARIVLWFLHAYPASMVVTTAPTFNQVENVLWRELRTAAAGALRGLAGEALHIRYEIAPDWYAIGFKAEDTKPDRFQGFHSTYPLVVIDEAAGVASTVYEALNAVMTSEHARLLLIGNPTVPEGVFYDAFHKDRALYNTITIAAHDTPNFTEGQTKRPYLVTPQWVEDAIATHGEDSPYVQARVYAQFPSLTDNALIPLAWIEAAQARTLEAADLHGLTHEAGLDVADMGGDENALCIRQGPRIVAEYAWSGVDTMETVGRVRHLLSQHPEVSTLRVDSIGVGAGVAARLRELSESKTIPCTVQRVIVSERPSDPEKYRNLRDELWWQLRERFREGDIVGPIGDVTMGQLSEVRYRYDSRHTFPNIESKDDARRRGRKSPDRADAVLLAFGKTRSGVNVWSTYAHEEEQRDRERQERVRRSDGATTHMGAVRRTVF